jgi:hypothetical protein
MQAKKLLSSANVDIVLSIATPGGGKPKDVVLGYMQDLSATEAYHLQPVKTLYNPLVSTYVRGVKECRGTARRAFVEWDSTLGLLSMVTEMSSDLGKVNSIIRTLATKGPISLEGALAGYQGLNSLSSLVSKFNATVNHGVNLNFISDLEKNQFSIGDLLSLVAFDLIIRTPDVDKDSNSSISQPIWRLKECFLDGRVVNFSIGNVVVMEEITFAFKDFKEEHWDKRATPVA